METKKIRGEDMKCDLVIASGELGLVDHDWNMWTRTDDIPVKRLSKGFTSLFNKRNVYFVDLEIEKKEKLLKMIRGV